MEETRLMVSESDVRYAMILMKQSIEYFIKCYEKALEETRGKNPKIVSISSEDVRNAAERMKREKYQYERPNRTGNRFNTDKNERKNLS